MITVKFNLEAAGNLCLNSVMLTPEQSRIVAQLVNGKTAKKIEKDLGYKKAGVSNRIKPIFNATGLYSTPKVAAAVVQGYPGCFSLEGAEDVSYDSQVEALRVTNPRKDVQREMLPYLIAGNSSKEIAHKIGSTPGSVNVHIVQMQAKLGFKNRMALMTGMGVLRYRQEQSLLKGDASLASQPNQPETLECAQS